ncbi:MAG: hypothetical protein ACM359_07160 [Bacillota bacterium]
MTERVTERVAQWVLAMAAIAIATIYKRRGFADVGPIVAAMMVLGIAAVVIILTYFRKGWLPHVPRAYRRLPRLWWVGCAAFIVYLLSFGQPVLRIKDPWTSRTVTFWSSVSKDSHENAMFGLIAGAILNACHMLGFAWLVLIPVARPRADRLVDRVSLILGLLALTLVIGIIVLSLIYAGLSVLSMFIVSPRVGYWLWLGSLLLLGVVLVVNGRSGPGNARAVKHGG